MSLDLKRDLRLNPAIDWRLDLAKDLREKLLAGNMKTAEKRGNSGSFAFRPQAIWHKMRLRGEPVFQCRATSKRSGERCRFSAIKGGSGVCYWHGGTGGDNRKPTSPTSRRHLGNKEIKRARLYAQAEVERRYAAGELREASDAIEPFIGKIHPADEARLVLALDQNLKGSLTVEAWREALRSVGIGSPRSPAGAPKPAAPEPPTATPVEWWRVDRTKPLSGF